MIPGFSNTSNEFYIPHEMREKISEFNKYDCEDVFFDLLCPELNIKGIIYFYYTSFKRTKELIAHYFSKTERSLKETACLTTLDGPIMNVLRKSYQSTWKKMQAKAVQDRSLYKICTEIQKSLNLGQNSDKTNTDIKNFLLNLANLQFCFYISDPCIQTDYKKIGNKVRYN